MNQISQKRQTSKRRVEQPISVDQPVPKKRSEQRSESEKGSKKNSSRGLTLQATPLVADTILQTLSKDLTFLQNRVSMLPSDTPIQVPLPKAMFHFDEDAVTWLSKEDVKEFLSGSMLNISLVQTFMRALQEHLLEIDSPCQVGWLCPEQISTTRILGNYPDVLYYVERGIKESLRAGDKFIFAPCFEDAHWTLLVICVPSNTIFLFDSARLPHPKKLLVKFILRK
ncbi:uncharacterized protein LOC110695827 [Chenopodium quinoa]|uniref:uncharacterized protein LOC110695827 n=1 Tax=Chenopodium quinoa TaxID=63459 RepID=UPI000B781AD5|nr:uncharacterized protein LOC110695827 [Chenopodium quinoa]